MNGADESRISSGKASATTDASGDRELPKAGLEKPGNEPAKFRLRNVLMIIVPVVAIALAIVLISGMNDLDAYIEDFTRPALVPTQGRLLYNGEPLRNGQIVTQPVEGRGLAALGWTDDEGRFTLQTDIRGSFREGATVGEHRVAVTVYQMIAAPAAPPLLTPQKYASISTSPLTITVGPDAEKNNFDLILEGEPASKPRPPKENSSEGKGDAQEEGEKKERDESEPEKEATEPGDAQEDRGDNKE